MIGRRAAALVGLGIRRVRGRLSGPSPGLTLLSAAGVAAAIAVLVIVTGIALGMAGSGTVASENANYWIVPAQEGVGSAPLAYEGPNLGAVHRTAATIEADERVRYATPVAIRPIRFETERGDSSYLLVLGVIPRNAGADIGGIDTSPLTPGDPYYENGSYNGTWTGEILVSPGGREQLGVQPREAVTAGSSGRTFTVTDVADQSVRVGGGTVPVAVVHLAELQAVTNTAADDQAAQLLVETDDASVRERLAAVYPRTNVVTRSGFSRIGPGSTTLPFAMAVAGGLVALGVGVAFVATMMGLELTASRRSIAVMRAVGIGRRSLGLVLVAETVSVALLGGILGIGLGWLGIQLVNLGLAEVVDLGGGAVFDPLLVPYGLLGAILVAVLSVGYPVYIAWRTDPLSEVGR